ncbi:MAG: thiamine-phosphate pyrophosphorylase [Candidatus Omnitrophota bacterium]
MKSPKTDKINRIIDANINRVKEGLRVCEEITRFILESRILTTEFKKTRHEIDSIIEKLPAKTELIKDRDSLKDVGLNIHLTSEFKRNGYIDIFFANVQRIKESVRVLEEFSKLKDINLSVRFKKIRYTIYEIEKKAVGKFPALRYPG